jgi:hypothetical protein
MSAPGIAILTPEAVEILFGKGAHIDAFQVALSGRTICGQGDVTLIGPRSRVISNLRILGPCRNFNQVELAYTDAIALGFEIPLRISGDIKGTTGGMLMGPEGFFEMPKASSAPCATFTCTRRRRILRSQSRRPDEIENRRRCGIVLDTDAGAGRPQVSNWKSISTPTKATPAICSRTRLAN